MAQKRSRKAKPVRDDGWLLSWLEFKKRYVQAQAAVDRPCPIGISYDEEKLWPFATLAALKAVNMDGQSIVSKAGHSQAKRDAEHILELAELGVHVVDLRGNCSCGLTVEVRHADGEDVPYETIRSIVLSSPGHFDHRSRTITNVFVAGRVGPSETLSMWARKPGPLIETRWHCVFCGDLGDALREELTGGNFEPHAHFEFNDWRAGNCGSQGSSWLKFKNQELKHWLQLGRSSTHRSEEGTH